MSVLTDGYQTLIEFALNPAVTFYEIEVTPPGLDALGKIDISTMHNTRWRTSVGKSLVTATDTTLVVAYDPVFYDEVLDMLWINQLITITFPDGATLDYYGTIDTLQPSSHNVGNRPADKLTI